MIKGDYIEYEFDLYSIKNEDVIENFKKRFGSIITKKVFIMKYMKSIMIK